MKSQGLMIMSKVNSNKEGSGCQYDGAAISTIERIHRDPDNFVSLMAKPGGGGIVHVGGTRVRNLPLAEPTIKKLLREDTYFSVNGFLYNGNSVSKDTSLTHVSRVSENLRSLNAVYADLDVGRLTTIGAGRCIEKLVKMAEDGDIPPLSAVARSGRGVYAFWLLKGSRGHGLPCTLKYEEDPRWCRAAYGTVMESLLDVLGPLHADRSARDTQRVLRVDGSMHTVAGEACRYRFFEEDGLAPEYSLDELLEFFGAKVRMSDIRDSRPTPVWMMPVKSVGGGIPKNLAEVGAKRVRDIRKLEQRRGGWEQGTRTRRIRVFVRSLVRSGVSRELAEKEGLEMARRCRPCLIETDGEEVVRGVVKASSRQKCGASTKTLVGMFKVTAKEARELELESIVPSIVKSSGSSKARKDRRDEAVLRVKGDNPRAGAETLSRLLLEEGISVSAATIRSIVKKSAERGVAVKESRGEPPSKSAGRLRRDEVMVVAEKLVEENPDKSYRQIANEARAKGIGVGYTAIRNAAIRMGLRSSGRMSKTQGSERREMSGKKEWDEVREAIRGVLDESPEMTLSQVVDKLKGLGISTSIPTVGRWRREWMSEGKVMGKEEGRRKEIEGRIERDRATGVIKGKGVREMVAYVGRMYPDMTVREISGYLEAFGVTRSRTTVAKIRKEVGP